MTFNVPSFFVGIATVLLTLTVGFGGGVLMTGVFSDRGGREPNKVARRAVEEAKPAPTPAIVASPLPSAAAQTPSQPASPETQAVAAAAQSPVQPTAGRGAVPPAAAQAPAPQPTEPVQTAPQVQPPQPAPPPPSKIVDETPALGPQRPVSLAQPDVEQAREAREASARAREARSRRETQGGAPPADRRAAAAAADA